MVEILGAESVCFSGGADVMVSYVVSLSHAISKEHQFSEEPCWLVKTALRWLPNTSVTQLKWFSDCVLHPAAWG